MTLRIAMNCSNPISDTKRTPGLAASIASEQTTVFFRELYVSAMSVRRPDNF